jgi:ADP-heptose:LPS heptosyltransferase
VALIWKPTLKKSALLAGALLLHRIIRPSAGGAKPGTEPSDIRSILVVELWNIGDVILVMPFLAQLRALFPKARITLLAAPHAEPLLRGTGLVDEFIETDLGLASGTDPAMTFRELRRVRARLRGIRFDIGFQARMHLREHLLLAQSGATRTVGYSLGGKKSLLTDAIPVADPGRHKVDDWMELLRPFGKPAAKRQVKLVVSAEEEAWASRFLSERGVGPNDEIIGIHPGASRAEKRWPLERFEEIAAALRERGHSVLAFVDPSGYGSSLARVTGLGAGQLELRQLMALIARCRLLVCNDSGPMHIAAALGIPTVAVFGPSVSQWFAPIGEGHEILTGDDKKSGGGIAQRTRAGVEAISTADVLAAVGRVLT